MEEYERKKSELWEEIDNFEQKVESLKKPRKQTKKHISFEELPDEEQFYRIARPTILIPPASNSHYWDYPRSSLLTCWLSFNQVGFFRLQF